MFRPTVQKLYQKLWGMKILHDQDNRVHILGRLAVELDPPHLSELLHQLQGRLFYKLGYIDSAQKRDWPILHFGDARWPWQWGEEPSPLEVGTAVHASFEAGDLLPLLPAEPLDLNAADKNRMLDVIKNHVYHHYSDTAGGTCSCGKSFNTSTEWAHHLRVRIWKEMTSGREDGVSEVRTPDVDRV